MSHTASLTAVPRTEPEALSRWYDPALALWYRILGHRPIEDDRAWLAGRIRCACGGHIRFVSTRRGIVNIVEGVGCPVARLLIKRETIRQARDLHVVTVKIPAARVVRRP